MSTVSRTVVVFLAAFLARPLWLARAYPYARRDHDFWLQDIHRAGDTGLSRYFNIGEGPVDQRGLPGDGATAA